MRATIVSALPLLLAASVSFAQAPPAAPATPAPAATPAPPRDPNLPAAEETAKAALESSPRHGEYVDIKNPAGDAPIRTWVVYPERKDKAGVVIVIHEIFGLSDWIRAVADQLARDGFIAVAPDLISGHGPGGGGTESVASRDDVVKLVRAITPEEATTRLNAVRDYAVKLPAASGKTATIGFCWGGARSFAYASAQPSLNAAVVYYGTSPEGPALATIKAPVLGLYGGDDARVNATIAPAEAEMKKLGQTYEPHVYEGAGHGFLRAQSQREGANLKATQQAWPRTIAFLRERLGGASAGASAPGPPVAKKQAHVVHVHGQDLADDYFWLRDKGKPEVEAHLNAELAYANAFMSPAEALQQKLYDEMLSRIQETDVNVPYREGHHFYYSRTQQGMQYPIYCRKKGSLQASEEVILDVNRLAEGKKFISVGDMEVSPDEGRLAYTTDETGFRQYTLHVKDLRSGKLGPEAIPRVTSVAWSEDGGRTLFYSVEHPQTKRSYQVFRHALGSTADQLVYEEKDERFDVGVGKSRDRQYLFLESTSHTTTEVRYLRADTPRGSWSVLAAREPEHEYDVDHHGDSFWIRTNDRGRNFRLVTAPATDPSRANWKEIVPHREDVMLSGHAMFKDFYVLAEREGGLPHLRVRFFADGQSHRITFPEAAYLVYLNNNREFDTKTLRFAYQSPVTSSSIYDYDPMTRERKLLKQVAVLGGFDPSRYGVELTRATAPDGVAVPMWMVYRKELMKKNGTNPALLFGYGSYGIAMEAIFNSNVVSLLDRGVVYAVAYVRGGGELGKKWHDSGRMMSKRNTFTDFIAAGEHLIAAGYAGRDRLAIMGGSAGGLLMGAVANMRPDLFKVVLAYVPFVDVINTMLDESLPLTVSEFEEWGNPKIAEQYRYMRSYSPYDNVEAKAYPTMLVKTSYNDSQVMYWEPAKYVAKLRDLKTDRNPLVFYVNMDPAGHGGKSGRYERLHDTAFDFAFLLWQLGVESPAVGAAAR